MSDSFDTNDSLDDTQQHELKQAARQLRERANPRAVQVANDVLSRALASARRSMPIAAHPPYDFLHISDQVLISQLRRAIDQTSHAVAVGRIHLRVETDARLAEITIEVFVQYGQVLLEAADQVRSTTRAAITDNLGPPPAATPTATAASTPAITIAPTQVHVSDITTNSPHLVNPNDAHLQ